MEMKDREIFSRLTTTVPFIIRLDGRAFHTLSAKYEKPFDERFSQMFIQTAKALLVESGLSPDLIYTFSDELSIYISKPIFEARVEKLVSISAGFASSAFSIAANIETPIAFDSRIIPLPESQLSEYLAWRQAEAWRNHINGYCHKILMDTGLSPSIAQKQLDGMHADKLHELAFKHGVNLAKTPAWQRRGIAIYHGQIEKTGFNPISRENVTVLRNTAVVDKDIPLFKSPDGKKWLVSKLSFSSPTDI